MIENGKPLQEAKKALILLHGRGSSAQEILNLSSYFCDESFYIVAPQANGNSWYPNSFLVEEKKNEPYLSKSIKQIKEIIEKIKKYLPEDKIYLMGFSQGACLTLEVAAIIANKYGGVVGFSGGLIGQNINSQKYKGNFKGTKIFIGVSENDPHIPAKRVGESAEILKDMGANVILDIYPGNSHTITQNEIITVQEELF